MQSYPRPNRIRLKAKHLWLQTLIITLATFWTFSALMTCDITSSLVSAQPCPKETPLYGGAKLDKSDDEYEQYFVVADDDLTRVTQFRYCKCCINNRGDYEHFRGFEVGITSPISGYSFQTFGTVNGTDKDTVCETYNFG